MPTTTKNFQLIQKVGDGQFLLIHPQTNATNVSVTFEDADSTLASVLSTLVQRLGEKANTSAIPDVSAFITKSVSDLENYYTSNAIDTKMAEMDNKLSAIPKFAISVVSALPTTGISDTTVYLVKSGNTDSNLYTEYIHVNNKWETLGGQQLDLTGYATQDWVNTQIANFVTETEMNQAIADATANVGVADKLSTARKIKLTGDAAGEASFDGTADASIAMTLADSGVTAGTYSAVQVDAKGRVTAGAQFVEVGSAGQETPSSNLAIGGLFLKLVE